MIHGIGTGQSGLVDTIVQPYIYPYVKKVKYTIIWQIKIFHQPKYP